MSQQESTLSTRTTKTETEARKAFGIPPIDESSWCQELEALNRLLTGRLTEAEAKEHAKHELARHDGIVNTIETNLVQARASVDTPFLPMTDRQRIAANIESLEYQLEQARKLRERSIRLNGAGIKDGKEADKLRPRWEELRKRAHGIETARNIGNREPSMQIGIGKRW